MDEPDWNERINGIKARYDELKIHKNSRLRSFLQHVENLSAWENDEMDYLESEAKFPDSLHVAFAVCHPDCGVRQFIVDGSTQECQMCGRLMFRISAIEYKKS